MNAECTAQNQNESKILPFCKYFNEVGFNPSQSPIKHTPLRANNNEFASIVLVFAHLPLNFKSSLMHINLRKNVLNIQLNKRKYICLLPVCKITNMCHDRRCNGRISCYCHD